MGAVVDNNGYLSGAASKTGEVATASLWQLEAPGKQQSSWVAAAQLMHQTC